MHARMGDRLVNERLALGVGRIEVEPGDHICAMYFGRRQRDTLLSSYLRAGLLRGDKCVAIVDSADPAGLVDRMDDQLDTRSCLATRQLELESTGEMYLSGGRFSADAMIATLEQQLSQIMADGRFPVARLAGEMSWSVRDVRGFEELIIYEGEVNRFAPRYSQVLLCMYDLMLFERGVFLDLLRTHPKLLIGGRLIDSRRYLPPDEFFASRR
jgi:hypothetical protein